MAFSSPRIWIMFCLVVFAATGVGCRRPQLPPDYTTLVEDTSDRSLFAEDARGERIDLAEVAEPDERNEECSGLQYLEVLTGGATHDEPLPMIVAIHGMGSRPEIFARVFSLFHEKARIILPRGMHPLGNGFSWFSLGYVGEQYEDMVNEIECSCKSLGGFVREAAKQHNTVGRPIVMGFSQGGMLTLTLALKEPEGIGLAIPMAGWVPPQLIPEAKAPGKAYPPIHLLHGERDARLPIAWAREQTTQLQARGFDIRLYEYKGLRHMFSRNLWPQLFALVGRELNRIDKVRASVTSVR